MKIEVSYTRYVETDKDHFNELVDEFTNRILNPRRLLRDRYHR